MKSFMIIFRRNIQSEQDFAQQSPEELQAELTKWGAWMGAIAESGKMIGGEQLLPNGKVLRGASKKLTDGPFIESKEIVGGHLVIKANDEADAIEISKGCPILQTEDGTVEIREILNVQN